MTIQIKYKCIILFISYLIIFYCTLTNNECYHCIRKFLDLALHKN